ncbi:diguanylate cyclase [Sulfuricurvum sp.]|uniref:diguanylate cyclase n=1 Tax=Sulfuricurvum sp. TaxID=2025608 RepID=UPI002E33F4BF|nr:diguanylate cyclase [Sulfuricurvum sp.]HEX5330309.1 diguanylate cyclase [Sulfuricurvum sp.]
MTDIGHNHKFSDLVDIVAFERLMESLYKATGIPNGLVAEDGELLSQIGWTNACALFHRVNAQTNQQCQESNIELMQSLHEGEVACAKCKNGLIDYATPVVIEGRRLATLFLGQVLSETPDMDFFRQRAVEVGYDEAEYIDAIRAVPIVAKEQMEALMDCMVGMAQMLAASGLARLRESIMEHNLNKSTEKRVQLEDLLDSSPIGIGWSTLDGKIEYINHQFTKLFGYVLEDIPTIDTWYLKAYPDANYRESILIPWYKSVITAYENGTTPPELEGNITCKDGSERHIVVRVSWVGDKRLVSFSDMTAHWQSERRNRAHDEMLEMVAKGSPLSEILHTIVHTIESEDTDALCSILLLDEEGKHLHSGAALSLPEFYNEAIDGVAIGMGVGSCGTAAFIGKRVIVEDIMSHEYWKPYAPLAAQAGLGSCWSEPIISSEGKVLGTFAIYHKKPTTPEESDIERIKFAANLAAIAIENRNARSELEHRAYSDYLTGLGNRRYFIEQAEEELSRRHRYGGELSLIMFDIDYFKKINDTYGHSVGDLVLQKIADICRTILREIDIIGRIGGEEFAILLPQTDAEEAHHVAERLRIAISEGQIKLEGAQPKFTASFGVVAAGGGFTEIDALLNQADTALYEAKESGRNRVCIAKKIQ